MTDYTQRSPEFQTILAKYNPKAKIPAKIGLELQRKLYLHNQMRKAETERERKAIENAKKGDFVRDSAEFGLDVQDKIRMEVNEAKTTILSLLFASSKDQIESLDILEFNELWKKLETENHPIIDFFGLRETEKETESFQPTTGSESLTPSPESPSPSQPSTPTSELASNGDSVGKNTVVSPLT